MAMILFYWFYKLQDRKGVLASSQDGGICRYASLPHRTKRRTTTNLKTNKQKTTRNARKSNSMEVRTKELKKKHSSRLVEEAEMGSWGRVDVG